MRQSRTISLPQGLSREIEKLTADEGITRSDVVRMAVSDYLYFRKFKKIRDRMMLKAQSKGVFTDEDVFSRVS